MRILVRFAAIVAFALVLSGCIISDFDISADLTPQFPLTAKAYRGEGGAITTFAVSGNEYIATDEDKKVSHLRFFKISEYSGYIMQFVGTDKDEKTALYAYFLADVSATEFTFHEWPKEAVQQLPAAVAALVAVDKEDNLTVKDGRRDTLAVIREIARAKLPTRPNTMTAVTAAK